MNYLVCLDHRPIHLTCRAAWLADALVRERMFAQQRGPVVHTSAPEARIEVLLSYRPVKATLRTVFAECDLAS